MRRAATIGRVKAILVRQLIPPEAFVSGDNDAAETIKRERLC
jgi:hypothetical protein